jgi:hypothetical protein
VLIGRNAPSGLLVTYNDVDIKRPRLISINVINSGNRGILEGDFTRRSK